MFRILNFLFLTYLVCSCHANQQNTAKEPLPNIVFIFTDDLGYGDLGCFGATDIKTPNIDKIASSGIRFTDFYSASSVCSPSRAGFLTGRMPQRMGINAVFFPESFTGMPPSEITIAEMLKEKGYTTGIIGKWHLGHFEKYLPLQQGFDEYFGIPYSNDMASVVYMRGNDVENYDVDQHYITQTYTNEALSFIGNHRDQPFFLYLAHNMPHVPIYASEKFTGSSNHGLYGDVIQELDWSVGQVIAQLEKFNLLENTLVVFSSDNGPWIVMRDYGGSAGVLREGKMFTFEGGMRVPTVAMWKGKIKPGTEYRGLASQMDWFPTFAKLTGSEMPKDRAIDGKDLSEVLLHNGKREEDDYLFFDGGDLQCYRKGKWKVKLPYEGFAGARWKQAVSPHDTLLFDLNADPGEKHNLYPELPEMAMELLNEMGQKRNEMGELPKSLVVRTSADESHFEHLYGENK